ncbi:MAG: hypothetical protein WC677_05190 [Clostridia bacterium]|jgi:hypothetical protein
MNKFLHAVFIVPALIILFIASAFIVWQFMPKHALNVVVLDKTVTINIINDNYNKPVQYRKHMGFYWILRYNHYVKPSNNEYYDYKRDYYGPKAGINGTVIDNTSIKLSSTPDLIYLSDAYGTDAISREPQSGLTPNEVSVVSQAILHGSTLVGEFNIEPSNIGNPVKNDIESIFGIKYSGWTGRLVADLANLNDIPAWVLKLYESNYHKQWNFVGSGIVLASNDSKIIILQQGKDYTNSLNIKIKEAYLKKYGNLKVNYYNWFEILTPENGIETVAEFNIPLTYDGRLKFNKISSADSFPAITLKRNEDAPVYYFAGDFNDYVAQEQYGDFVFADTYNRIFAYDKPGDNANFFWNFYTPFMEVVLKDAEYNSANKTPLNK